MCNYTSMSITPQYTALTGAISACSPPTRGSDTASALARPAARRALPLRSERRLECYCEYGNGGSGGARAIELLDSLEAREEVDAGLGIRIEGAHIPACAHAQAGQTRCDQLKWFRAKAAGFRWYGHGAYEEEATEAVLNESEVSHRSSSRCSRPDLQWLDGWTVHTARGRRGVDTPDALIPATLSAPIAATLAISFAMSVAAAFAAEVVAAALATIFIDSNAAPLGFVGGSSVLLRGGRRRDGACASGRLGGGHIIAPRRARGKGAV